MLGPTDEQLGEAIRLALSEPDGPQEPFADFIARVSAEALGEPWAPKPEDPKHYTSGWAIERKMRGL